MRIAERISATGGRTSGFDYLRIGLAIAVVCFHSALVSYGREADTALWGTWLRPFARAILPMFFALSGYLVAGSLARSKSVTKFLGLRLIRIYPALAVEVFLSALVLGPLVSTVDLGDYLRSPLFHQYLLNVTGNMHYQLPGMFASNPFPGTVNAQLWTVPYELECYLWLATLSVLGLAGRRFIAVGAAVGFSAVNLLIFLQVHGWRLPTVLATLPGPQLVVAFLAGVCIYLYGDKIPWSGRLAAGAAGLSLVLLSVPPLGDYVSPFVIAYLTVYIGLCDPPRLALVRGADYSYGVFLYGFAIQQTFASLGPWTHQWWLSILVCVPGSVLVAALSWHLVEKPALTLRNHAAWTAPLAALWPRLRRAPS